MYFHPIIEIAKKLKYKKNEITFPKVDSLSAAFLRFYVLNSPPLSIYLRPLYILSLNYSLSPLSLSLP